jgi:heat shock protein HslJ
MKVNKRRAKLLLFSVLLVVVTAACAGEDTEDESADPARESVQDVPQEGTSQEPTGVEKGIQVSPILVDCQGEGPQECMLIREHEMDKWELWYSSIEGFEYEEGFLYDLWIEEQTVDNPPAGGSSMKWVLVEVLDTTPVNISTIIVGPEQVDCVGAGPQLCNQVKNNPEEDWQFFYSQIEGFQFEAGYEYELLVAEVPVKNPPADASSFQYLLVEEVSKTQVEPEETEQVNVTGTIWAATTINGQPIIEGSEVLLGIAPGRIGGFSGCNTYFGPVETNWNEVAVGAIGSTRIACAEELMNQESEFLGALDSAATVIIKNGQMTVYNEAGEMILKFSHVEPLPLEGPLWELAAYSNGQNAMVSILPDAFVTANFEDGQVSGSAGCNSYFGAYETSGDLIQIGPLASTMMACADPVNEQEHLYLAALDSAATFQIIANRLEVISEEGALAAMYQAVEPVELPGTSWDVLSYDNGRGGVTSVIIGTELTLNFDEETVAGLAGCNNYNGGYEVDGQKINFGPLATTRKFCSDPEGTMDQESEFLAALENAARYEIEGDQMDVFFEDGARAMTLERMK